MKSSPGVKAGARNTQVFKALLLLCVFAAGCGVPGSDDEAVEFTGATMGTTYSVKTVGIPKGVDRARLTAGFAEVLAEVNGKMSTYQPDSELSRFNRHSSDAWMGVSSELASVVKQALSVSDLSRGAFDVTVGPIVNLWGFGPGGEREGMPLDSEVSEALARVGYQGIGVRSAPPAIRKERPDIYVDLSAIAKGYAVDRIAEYLESQGILRYLVEVGGELRAKGRNVQGVPWRIAIEKPVTDRRAIQTVIELAGNAVATSGDYRNYFENDGQRFSHTINPRTGRPITHKLASVAVIHPSAMRADALATALMVLGPEEGYALAEEEQLAALFIVKSGESFTENATPAFERYTVH